MNVVVTSRERFVAGPGLPGSLVMLAATVWLATGTSAGAAEPSDAESPAFQVNEVPQDLRERLELDPFYEKYVDAEGFPVLGSGDVSDYAMKEAAFLIGNMLAERPDIRQALIESKSRVVVMAFTELTTDVPEHSHLKPKNYWDRRARGLGGSRTDPVCSCAEENLLAYPGDPYHEECILIHEFAHLIHHRGLSRTDDTFNDRLKTAYEKAMAAGLWKGTYAATNKEEYWAEGVQSWFNNNRPPDHDHNHVDTRKELKEYDPALAGLCEEVFGETVLNYVRPPERKKMGHLAGYNPGAAPRFRWPAELEKWYTRYRKEQ